MKLWVVTKQDKKRTKAAVHKSQIYISVRMFYSYVLCISLIGLMFVLGASFQKTIARLIQIHPSTSIRAPHRK